MLTAYQHKLIDELPNEGGCFYYQDGKKIDYAPEAAAALARLPLQGLYRASAATPIPSQKEARILHGAPGSGKSYVGMGRLQREHEKHKNILQHTAIISYDEVGALYDIPEYVAALKKIIPEFDGKQSMPLSPERALETMAARHQLWLDFQPLSQHIRSVTLKNALRYELSLYIDITSSSPGAFRMIETLRELDYQNIEIWSVHAPLDVARDRIVQRARPISGHDYMVKRVGAYETLPHLCGEADRMVIALNEEDGKLPVIIAILENGQVRKMDPVSVSYLNDRLAQESAEFIKLARTHLPEVKDLDLRYVAATVKFREFIESYNPNSRTSLTQSYYHKEMQRQP